MIPLKKKKSTFVKAKWHNFILTYNKHSSHIKFKIVGLLVTTYFGISKNKAVWDARGYLKQPVTGFIFYRAFSLRIEVWLVQQNVFLNVSAKLCFQQSSLKFSKGFLETNYLTKYLKKKQPQNHMLYLHYEGLALVKKNSIIFSYLETCSVSFNWLRLEVKMHVFLISSDKTSK